MSQDISDINYNKKDTPFLVNDILEEGSAPYPGPGPVRMNCSPPPSPGSQSALSPSLLYSSYPGRPSVTATSMAASFSPTTMTSSGAVPSKWEGSEHFFSSSLLNLTSFVCILYLNQPLLMMMILCRPLLPHAPHDVPADPRVRPRLLPELGPQPLRGHALQHRRRGPVVLQPRQRPQIRLRVL